MCFTPHHPSLCSVGGVIAAGGLLPACGHPNCDSRGSFPGPALCRVCEEGHGPYQHCCHDGGRCCLCWPYHRRSVSQTMHRLATELHNAQCTVACTALQLSCTVHSAMHSTAQHSTAQHSLGHSQNASSFFAVTLTAVIAEQVSFMTSVKLAAGQPHKQCTDLQLSCTVHSGLHSLSIYFFLQI